MQITTMTPFSTSTRDPRLDHRNNRTFLLCDAQKHDHTWAPTSTDLDALLGNTDGSFDTSGAGRDFTQSAQNIRLERDAADGSWVLKAQLRTRAGEWRDAAARPADWLANYDGRVAPGRARSLRRFEVVTDDRTFFMCEAQQKDGAWAAAKIDLDRFVGNDDGRFDVAGTGSRFTASARDVFMKYEGAGGDIRPVLVATLRDKGGEWRVAEVDLLDVLKNVDGRLEFRGRNQHGPQ